MNPRLFLPALLAASLASAQPAAPDAAPAKPDSAPAAPAEAKTEMQKWIEATDGQWQAAFKRDVADVREAEAKKQMLQYLNMLEDGIGKASKASDLDGAVALRNEQKRFGETQLFPEQDDAADTAAVKEIRTAIRAHLAKLETDTALRAKALHAKYDQVLAQAQTQLTQRQRFDDALLVQKKREEVAAAWLTPGVKAVPDKVAVLPAVPAKPKAAVASDDRNLFTNSNFEKGLEGWEVTAFEKNGTAVADAKELHNGKPTLRIDIPGADFVYVRQKVGKPNTRYRLTGYIKTKNVEAAKKGKQGALLMVGFTAQVRNGSTPPIQKTKAWTQVSVDFTTTDKADFNVGAGLGYYNSNVTGTAWFSDLSLIELGPDAKK